MCRAIHSLARFQERNEQSEIAHKSLVFCFLRFSVGDAKQKGPARPVESEVFEPYLAMKDEDYTRRGIDLMRSLALVIRTKNDPASMTDAAKAVIAGLDSSLPVTDVATMSEVMNESASSERFNTLLIGGFAGAALLLAAAGIGGVLIYTVSQRTREIGLRIALGAKRGDIVQMVLKEGSVVAAAGIGCGLVASVALSRLMASLLYGTSPYDGVTFGCTAAVLLGIGLLASWWPAWMASRVDPMEALRQE